MFSLLLTLYIQTHRSGSANGSVIRSVTHRLARELGPERKQSLATPATPFARSQHFGFDNSMRFISGVTRSGIGDISNFSRALKTTADGLARYNYTFTSA